MQLWNVRRTVYHLWWTRCVSPAGGGRGGADEVGRRDLGRVLLHCALSWPREGSKEVLTVFFLVLQECVRLEKSRDGCPKIVNLGGA